MDRLLAKLYGEELLAESRKRCRMVLEGYRETFGDGEVVLLFSSPGRTELSGNHSLVFVARASITSAEFSDICTQMRKLLERAGILSR